MRLRSYCEEQLGTRVGMHRNGWQRRVSAALHVGRRAMRAPIITWFIAATFVRAAAPQREVQFILCSESDHWTRPPNDVQAQIWSDNRYREPGPQAYEWTHAFIWNDPQSASITYHNLKLSGLWTQPPVNHCPRREQEPDPWVEVWALNYHVREITLVGSEYNIRVAHRDKGYEVIQFRRASSLDGAHASARFVTDEGAILEVWVEKGPGVFSQD